MYVENLSFLLDLCPDEEEEEKQAEGNERNCLVLVPSKSNLVLEC